MNRILRRHRILVALVLAYGAGVWVGSTDSWWVIAAAFWLMFSASWIANLSAAAPDEKGRDRG